MSSNRMCAGEINAHRSSGAGARVALCGTPVDKTPQCLYLSLCESAACFEAIP